MPLACGELLDHRTGARFGCMPMSADAVYWYATWRGENANSPSREGRLAVTGTETRRALRVPTRFATRTLATQMGFTPPVTLH